MWFELHPVFFPFFFHFLPFICWFFHSFHSFALLSVFKWRTTFSTWVWLKSWQLAHKNKWTWKIFVDTVYMHVEKCRQMATEIAHMRSHSSKWVGFIVCSRKVYIRWCQELLLKLHLFFFAVFLHFRFVFSLLFPPGSVWMLLPEKMPFWCAVIAAIPNSLAVEIVCSWSLRHRLHYRAILAFTYDKYPTIFEHKRLLSF